MEFCFVFEEFSGWHLGAGAIHSVSKFVMAKIMGLTHQITSIEDM
jgi:hypothetical protein